MKKVLAAVNLAVLLLGFQPALNAAAQPGPTHLKPSDRIVFLGDSITEQQLYSNYVENYLTLRYPDYHFTFFNAGWGGDTAPGGLRRLERDVLALDPAVVTICFGMNDAEYADSTPEIVDIYATGMRGLVKALKARKVRVILLTPGYADEDKNENLKKVRYSSRGLRVLADEILKLARQEALPVFDINALMAKIDAQAKAQDPKFCMVPDAVHPDPAGHLIMAYGLLKAMGVPPRHGKLSVDASAEGTTTGTDGSIAELRRTQDGFSLRVRPASLPFYIEKDARKVLPYLPFVEEFNSLRLSVKGLDKAGRYQVRYNKLPGRLLDPADLEKGIELSLEDGFQAVQIARTVHNLTVEQAHNYFSYWRRMALEAVPGEKRLEVMAMGMENSLKIDAFKLELCGQAASKDGFLMRLGAYGDERETLVEEDPVTWWSVAGPFPQPMTSTPLGDEALLSSEPKPGPEWKRVSFFPAEDSNCLNKLFGGVENKNCFAYALNILESPSAQQITLTLGSDDGYAVWLNGKCLASALDLRRGFVPDQENLVLDLKAGRNILLVKISQVAGEWGFGIGMKSLEKPVMLVKP